LIADFGSMYRVPKVKADKTIDANGKMILPSWCDSHIVYAGNREQVCRSHKWLSYEKPIGGGILNSAKSSTS
jgi:imidazolonepropionase